MLIRSNNTTGELAFYRCWTPDPATLTHLVRVAGIRWTVEESNWRRRHQARVRRAHYARRLSLELQP